MSSSLKECTTIWNLEHGLLKKVSVNDVLSKGQFSNFLIFLTEFRNPNSIQNPIPNYGLMVPFGDTFLDVSHPNGEVYKFNPDGPAGSKWILMPEKGLSTGIGYQSVRKDSFITDNMTVCV